MTCGGTRAYSASSGSLELGNMADDELELLEEHLVFISARLLGEHSSVQVVAATLPRQRPRACR
jgi:hypothetical protein